MFPILADLAAILQTQFAKSKVWSDDLKSEQWSWDWGWRINPVTNETQWHNGIDLPAPTGTPVYCPWPGVVNTTATDDLNGNYIKITHNPAECEGVVETAYVHLSEIDVAVNAPVAAGQMIGKVGSTGRSTGPHLHFIIRTASGSNVEGTQRRDADPVPYLEDSLKKTIHGASIAGSMLLASVLLFWWFYKH